MHATTFVLLMATLFGPPAQTSAGRSTRIYVRTTPPGASIVVDGKELGTSDGLFLVPPGVRTITLEMDGYDPEAKRVDVREGWITRVEVTMNRGGTKPDEAGQAASNSESLHFVRWVIQDEKTMTFEGEPVTLDQLPSLLEKMPNRSQTVLEVGYSSEISVRLRNEYVGRATAFAQQFGFKYASDIGQQKLGSRGSPAQEVEVDVRAGENVEEDALSAEANESVSVPIGSRGLLSELRNIQVELAQARQKYAGQHPEIKRLEEKSR
ncbi:MAG: PEGA domain-containing protein, partial [Thermoguttaceae bacterium]